MIYLIVLILLGSVSRAFADYPCLCCNTEERSIHVLPDSNSSVVGMVYRFDCFPILNKTSVLAWTKIQFSNKVGYVTNDSFMQEKTCFGSLPTTVQVSNRTVVPPASFAPNTNTKEYKITSTMQTSASPSLTSRPSSATSTYSTTPSKISTSMSFKIRSTSTIKTTPQLSTKSTDSTSVRHSSSSNGQTDTPVTSAKPSKMTTFHPFTWTTTDPPKFQSGTAISSPFLLSVVQNTTQMRTTPKQDSFIKQLSSTTSSTLCPPSTDSSVKEASHGHSCYQFVWRADTFSHAQADCAGKGGFLFEVSSAEEEIFILRLLSQVRYTGYVWMGLHDRNNEGSFEWLSGSPVTYTNWVPGHTTSHHFDEDCTVFMAGTFFGQWKDVPCEHGNDILFNDNKHPWICQFDNDRHLLNLCPPSDGDKIATAGHGRSCYLLEKWQQTFHGAEGTCKRKGGFLAEILNNEDQLFLYNFLRKSGVTSSVWLGLHIQGSKRSWEWVSGSPVTYSNWVPNHHNDHNVEDCAKLSMTDGFWDDSHCNYDYENRVVLHRYVCQFS